MLPCNFSLLGVQPVTLNFVLAWRDLAHSFAGPKHATCDTGSEMEYLAVGILAAGVRPQQLGNGCCANSPLATSVEATQNCQKVGALCSVRPRPEIAGLCDHDLLAAHVACADVPCGQMALGDVAAALGGAVLANPVQWLTPSVSLCP